MSLTRESPHSEARSRGTGILGEGPIGLKFPRIMSREAGGEGSQWKHGEETAGEASVWGPVLVPNGSRSSRVGSVLTSGVPPDLVIN